MLMDVKVELISNPIIRSCTIFFGFVFISLRSHLILTVRLHRFYLCICAHSPLRSYVCYVMLCSACAFLIHRINIILRSSLRTWCTIVTPARVQSTREKMTTQAGIMGNLSVGVARKRWLMRVRVIDTLGLFMQSKDTLKKERNRCCRWRLQSRERLFESDQREVNYWGARFQQVDRLTTGDVQREGWIFR